MAVSETGDWLLFIALPLYVLAASGSALDTSSVFLAELIPAVVIGIFGAPLIDRWNPGRLLATLTGLQALVVVPLLWVGHGSLWLIYAVAAAQAAFTSLTTPAQQAVVPLLVDPSQVLRANAVVEMASNAARLLGSPLAVGIPATAAGTGLISGTQQASPRRLRGRILSLAAVSQALGQATGILAAGLLSAVTPLLLLLNAQAGCYLARAIIAACGFDRPQRNLIPSAADAP